MRTIIISAFPCCGKTYAYENYQDDFSILDSDSSEFSWVKDENGENTKDRNPKFPRNYIQHIKENIGKVEIIFVSSHLEVRKALEEERIPFSCVYPQFDLLEEWVGRMYLRGDSASFINLIVENWDTFVLGIWKEPHGNWIARLRPKQYIDLNLLNDLYYNIY